MIMCNLLALISVTFFLKVSFAGWLVFHGTSVIEPLYMKDVLRNKNYKNSICELQNNKKIAICNMLFERVEFKLQLNIFINKNAFKNLPLGCASKEFKFLINKNGFPTRIKQQMFPCYGRHEPMQTNYFTDDYFDTFYVSGDYNRRTLYLYKMVKNADTNYIKLHTIYHSVNYESIPPQRMPDEKKIKRESMTLQHMSFARNGKYIEIIHLREMFNHQLLNSVCILDRIQKIKLCRRIFERRHYMKHEFVLNIQALSDDEPQCEKKIVSFPHLISYNKRNELIKQLMLPCFGKYLGETRLQSWQNDMFLKQFSIAAGPRENSVFVYSQLGNTASNLYRVYEFVQNINLGLGINKDTVVENDIRELLTNIENRRVVLPHFYRLVTFDEEEEEKGMKGTEEDN